jgi:hypothetical protein
MTLQAFAIGHPEVAAERTRGLVLVATAAGGLDRTPIGRSTESLAQIGPLLDRALASRFGHHLVRGTLGKGASHAAVRATRDHFVGTPFATRHGILQGLKRWTGEAALHRGPPSWWASRSPPCVQPVHGRHHP